MFDNIGEKIKAFSKISYYIFCAIYGIGGFITSIAISVEESEFVLFLLGIVAVIVALFANWIFFAFIYAFGELVDNSQILVDINQKLPVNSMPGKVKTEKNIVTSDKVIESSENEKKEITSSKPNTEKQQEIIAEKPHLVNNSTTNESLPVGVKRISPETENEEYYSGAVSISSTEISFKTKSADNCFSINYNEIISCSNSGSGFDIKTANETIKFSGLSSVLSAIENAINNSDNK